MARGARVLATASEGNHAFLRELGAEPLDQAAQAHARVEAGHVRGKLVLSVS